MNEGGRREEGGGKRGLVEVGSRLLGGWSDEAGVRQGREGGRTANQLQMSAAEREIKRVKDGERGGMEGGRRRE